MRPAGGGDVVFALIEIDAGLLAVAEIGFELESVHADVDALRDVAGEDLGFLAEIFELADEDVVAGEDAFGLEQFLEAIGDGGAGGVHTLIEELDDEVVTVAIDHEAGQEVAFSVNEAIGIGVLDGALAEIEGRAEAVEVEGAVEGFVLVGEEAESDLRGGAVMGDAEALASLIENADRFAGLGLAAVSDVAGIDPRMSGLDADLCLAADLD